MSADEDKIIVEKVEVVEERQDGKQIYKFVNSRLDPLNGQKVNLQLWQHKDVPRDNKRVLPSIKASNNGETLTAGEMGLGEDKEESSSFQIGLTVNEEQELPKNISC